MLVVFGVSCLPRGCHGKEEPLVLANILRSSFVPNDPFPTRGSGRGEMGTRTDICLGTRLKIYR